MNQYEFQVINKRTGAKDQIRATAYNELEAYKAVYNYYSQGFDIETHASKIRPPHAVLGEIDCI
jgi:hypothetical protein